MSTSSEKTPNNNNQSTKDDKKRECDYCDVFKTLLQDMPFLITVLLIASFFGAFIIVMILKPDLLIDIAAIWGAWIGTAIGYFFGSRPVDSLIHNIFNMQEKRVKELEKQKEESDKEKTEICKAMTEYEIRVNELIDNLERVNTLYKESKSDIKKHIDCCDSAKCENIKDSLKNKYLRDDNE